jgi:hypothetical protein
MGHLSPERLGEEWTASRGALRHPRRTSDRLPGGDFVPPVASRLRCRVYWLLKAARWDGDPSDPTIVVRFTIQRRTSSATAAALAAGQWLPCAQQIAFWNMKKVVKHIGGERYLQVRRLLLRHGRDVEWGDVL